MEQPKQDNEEIRISTEQIHWSKDDPSKLDLEYHRGVGTLRKAVLIGAVLPLVSSLTSILGLLIVLHFDMSVIVYLPYLFVGIIGIIGGLGIAKRKPNAIYLCKVFAWSWTGYILFVLAVAIMSFSYSFFIYVLLLIYGLYVLYTLYTSNDVKLVFPKEYRKIGSSDIILTVTYICLLVFAVGYMVYGFATME